MWLTLDRDLDGAPQEQLLARLEALAQYVARLQQTLLASGIDGISGALQLARHAEEVLAHASVDDIGRLRRELRACEERLRAMVRTLDDLRLVKLTVDDQPSASARR